MKIQNSQYISQLQENLLKQTPAAQKTTKAGMSFQDILTQKADKTSNQPTAQVELKFSKHAAGRLNDRNISLSGEQMDRLTAGAMKAGEKGIKESLVMVDSLAFIVNIPNSTVVTAMDSTETNENIYTNIDGAVIM